MRNGAGSDCDFAAYVMSEKAVSDQIWMKMQEQNTWPVRSLRILPAGQTLILCYSRTLGATFSMVFQSEGAVGVSSRKQKKKKKSS